MPHALALVAVALTLLLSAGCAPEPHSRVSTATVNLAKASGTKTIACEGAFAAGVRDSDTATDGSTWSWVKAKDGTISHYCQLQPNGALAAWEEASRVNGATHSLIYRSDMAMARFEPIRR